jgi:hypothetical protein
MNKEILERKIKEIDDEIDYLEDYASDDRDEFIMLYAQDEIKRLKKMREKYSRELEDEKTNLKIYERIDKL